MSEPELIHTHVDRDDAADRLVRDVMVSRPKTLPADATVGDLRREFENPRVQTALLAEDGRFAGAVAPAELPDTADASEPARAYARADIPTLAPDATMTEAIALLEARGDFRPRGPGRRGRRRDARRPALPRPPRDDVLHLHAGLAGRRSGAVAASERTVRTRSAAAREPPRANRGRLAGVEQRHVGLDVEHRRAVEQVDAADPQRAAPRRRRARRARGRSGSGAAASASRAPRAGGRRRGTASPRVVQPSTRWRCTSSQTCEKPSRSRSAPWTRASSSTVRVDVVHARSAAACRRASCTGCARRRSARRSPRPGARP